PRLLSDIKETYEDRSETSYMQLFERLVGVDLLHIDDLGAEKRTEWVLEQVYSIINDRWQEQRSVIVTTNLIDVDELRDQIGPRTVSRLHEMCDLIPIMPYHKLLDQEGEARLGKLQIGTTKRGIGPCYADKASRLGIRVQDLLDEKILRQKIYAALEPKRQLLRPYEKDPIIDLQTMVQEYRGLGQRLAPYIADTPPIIWDALDNDCLVVFEGAQGTLLDIDHGTYPFVTSSNPVAGSATIGAGVGPKDINEVWGVTKAYATRVGSGPFACELNDELGERLREAGGEYGTTTGRARRTGWLDLVALRYAAR